MRWFITLWLLFLFACFAKVNVHPFVKQKLKLNLTEKEFPVPTIFENYVFQAHTPTTIIEEYDVHSNYRNIGVFVSHSMEYQVFTSFKRIQLANGYRGRSAIGFIQDNGDTLLFNAEMPENLPVDLYKNHFVFQRADSSYFFQTPDTLNSEICCFKPPIYCMLGYEIIG